METLNEIIGFSNVKNRLMGISFTRLTNPLILHGTSHTGKYALALQIARTSVDNADNIHVVSTPDGKSQIPIDKIREMMDEIKLQPYQGDKRRFVIIREATNLNHASENALLKLFEEPPSHVSIIVTASDISRLLPTIRSRCHALKAYHTMEELQPLYDSLNLDSSMRQFAEITLGTQVGILLGLKDADKLKAFELARDAVLRMETAENKDILYFHEALPKAGIQLTLQSGLRYYEHMRKMNLLKPIYDALMMSSAGLNWKLVIDKLIFSLARTH